MRIALAPLLVVLPTIARAAPDVFAAFEPALVELPATDNATVARDGSLELLKRQAGCPGGYNGCDDLGAPGLCCRPDAACSADANNNVACCPNNAECTGTIGGVLPPGNAPPPTLTSPNNLPPSSTAPFITAEPTGTTTFDQDPATGGASTVPNSYYPFAFIPTTYDNAAACSSAYTSCSADAASCTAALASGQQGITVEAPNGGVTVTAVASLGLESAASVCESLSSRACYQLTVEACGRYGEGGNAAVRCRGVGGNAGAWAGVAVGIMGGLLR